MSERRQRVLMPDLRDLIKRYYPVILLVIVVSISVDMLSFSDILTGPILAQREQEAILARLEETFPDMTESVIIDEGFGSLDKNGRDDMIQELNELKQQLARIILVSHQEEFTGAFVNGYAVELKDGTSRVSLLEQA